VCHLDSHWYVIIILLYANDIVLMARSPHDLNTQLKILKDDARAYFKIVIFLKCVIGSRGFLEWSM
jgi:hypothetical protein